MEGIPRNIKWDEVEEVIGVTVDRDKIFRMFSKYREKRGVDYEAFNNLSLKERRKLKNAFLENYMIILFKGLISPIKYKILKEEAFDKKLLSFDELLSIIDRHVTEKDKEVFYKKLIVFELAIENSLNKNVVGYEVEYQRSVEDHTESQGIIRFNETKTKLEDYLWLHNLLHESREFKGARVR